MPTRAMSVYESLLYVLAVSVGILLVTSAISYFLRRHIIKSKRNNALVRLDAYISTWWNILAVLGFTFLFGGKIGVTILFAFVSFSALREFLTIVVTNRADHLALVVAFFVILPLQYLFVGFERYTMFLIFIPVYAFMLLPALSAIRGNVDNFLERISEKQFALMVAVYAISYVPALLFLEIEAYEGRNVLLITWLILVVQLADIYQYFIGRLFGKRLLSPNISRVKTVEGHVFGALLAAITGVLLYWITPFSMVDAFFLAFFLANVGLFGSLIMEAIKRDRGFKEWSGVLAGHGGIIERMDGVIFAAPLYFHIINFAYT